MPSVRIEGTEKLARAAAVLAEHADGRSLKNKLRRDFRNAGGDITREQRESLASGLPKRGGLAATLATEGRFSVSTRLAGKSVAVDIVDSWRGHNMRAVEEGQIRHPLYGNRGHWFTTQTPRSLLSRPVLANRRRLEVAIIRSLDELALEIDKEIR